MAKAKKRKSSKTAVKKHKTSGSSGGARKERQASRVTKKTRGTAARSSAKDKRAKPPPKPLRSSKPPQATEADRAVAPPLENAPSLPKTEILKQEVELVFRRVNHFDQLRHGTKQWAVALTLGTVVAGLALASPWMVFLAALVPIPLWYLDATYHAHQEGWNKRFWKIQAYLSGRWKGEAGDFPIPDYYASHSVTNPGAHDFLTSPGRNAFTPRMKTFYAPLVIVPIVLAIVTSMKGGS